MNDSIKTAENTCGDSLTKYPENSFGWAVEKVFNGPNGKEALEAIKFTVLCAGVFLTICVLRGYEPSLRAGNVQLAFNRV